MAPVKENSGMSAADERGWTQIGIVRGYASLVLFIRVRPHPLDQNSSRYGMKGSDSGNSCSATRMASGPLTSIRPWE